MTKREFQARLRAAGLTLDEAEAARLFATMPAFERILKRLRTPLPGIADEPALIYDLERSER